MGIDYGTKRVGIALTDETGTMSFPRTVLKNTDTLLTDVLNIVTEEQVSTIVVGRSLDLGGQPNAVQEHIDQFVEALARETDCTVVAERETFTTQEALRIQGRTAHTDASAAALILDSYLQKQKHD